MPIKPFLIPPGTVLVLALLSGCGGVSSATLCPNAVILAEAAQMTQFRSGAAADLSGAAYTVTLTRVSTACNFDKRKGTTASSLNLNFRATRAPTAEAADYAVPYFVAVTQGDRMLSKKIFSVHLRFAPGAAVASFSEDVDETDIKLENGHGGFDYQLVAGLQLTTAEREYNKKTSPYIP